MPRERGSIGSSIDYMIDDQARLRHLAKRKAADRTLRIAGLIVLTCGLVAIKLWLRPPGAGQLPAISYTFTSVSTPAPMPTPKAIDKPVYPLKRSKDGRRLVDQNNTPFLLVGDAPHSLIGNLSEADAATYFAARAAQGFNAAWIEVLCASYTGCNADGTTKDGIAPFTTPGDLSTPNPAYFQRVDDMLTLAAKYGITVFLDPSETGSWLPTFQANGPTKDFNFGVYLGTRYASFPNIVWISGNDFQTWGTPSDDADILAVANGIASVDTAHLQTSELSYPVSDSLTDPAWAARITLDGVYTYFPTYAEMLTAYNRHAAPIFLEEGNYEGGGQNGNLGTPAELRRQDYWAMLSGGTGQIYGNAAIWPFSPGWQTQLTTPGTQQLGYATALFSGRAWYTLVPDQTHAVVTAGYGTFAGGGTVLGNDYLTAARTPDGSLVLAYLPTVRTITVDLTKLSGTVTARWYDPTTGAYSTVAGSPFANTGTQAFTPTGNNSAGDGDWVLVLEAT